MRASAVFALVFGALAATPAVAQSLVYRVDQATAVIDGNRLIVTAKGAVRSGGWDHPRLVVRKSAHERGDIEIRFLATPPPNSSVVVQSILPVTVSFRTRLPRNGVAAVRILSETNSVTAEIIPKYDHQRTAVR